MSGEYTHTPLDVAAGILSGKYTITSVYVLVNQVDRQARHIEELRSKIDADRSCACSFDAPGDVCAAHSPALVEARAEVDRLRAENERLRENVDRLGKEVERSDRLREEIARVKADNRSLVNRALENKP